MSEKNYILRTDGEFIRFELKNGAGADYFTPNRDLFQILERWHVSPFTNGGRLQCDIWQGSRGTPNRLYLYDLIYASYSGAVHSATLKEDLQKYFDWKHSQGLTIDHIDGNTHNGTVWNLSLMPLSANVGKKSFPAGFVPPYNLIMAYVDGEYRVQMILQNTERDYLQQQFDRVRPGTVTLGDNLGVSTLNFLCQDAESLVSCLKYLYNARFGWCNPGETAKKHRQKNRDIVHTTPDIKKSLIAQSMLAMMDRSMFQPFPSGE